MMGTDDAWPLVRHAEAARRGLSAAHGSLRQASAEHDERVSAVESRPPLPLELRWHTRTILMPWPGQYRLTVAVRGGPAGSEGSRRLSQQLETMWVHDPDPGFPAASAVAAALVAEGDPRHARRYQLHVVLSLKDGTVDERVAGPLMARQLRIALRAVGHPSAS